MHKILHRPLRVFKSKKNNKKYIIFKKKRIYLSKKQYLRLSNRHKIIVKKHKKKPIKKQMNDGIKQVYKYRMDNLNLMNKLGELQKNQIHENIPVEITYIDKHIPENIVDEPVKNDYDEK